MKANFWEGYVRPGKVFGNIYFVGTRPASSHLIDTGDGLILLDAGFPEAIDGLLENIRSLGFDPMDIRII
ncbi:MBL fold metallo-hydrolase, partial [Escherichia coli]|uniref:MBL fold metallo-hydrolase n=1 Tax=Escherichia coli TaxID=562 RepID=UPI001E56B481